MELPTSTISQPVEIERQRDYYNQRWSAARLANPLERRRAAAIMALLCKTGINEPAILDLGCGTGWFSDILSHFGPTTATDLSDEAIDSAGTKYSRVQFISGDMFELDLPASSFDIVVSQEVIEHVENQDQFAKLAARLLKPGGYLIVTTPNRSTLERQSPQALARLKLQPIENWLTAAGLRSVLKPHFWSVSVHSIILGRGRRGLHRLVNSTKLINALSMLGLRDLWDLFRQRAGYGLHLVAFASKDA